MDIPLALSDTNRFWRVFQARRHWNVFQGLIRDLSTGGLLWYIATSHELILNMILTYSVQSTSCLWYASNWWFSIPWHWAKSRCWRVQIPVLMVSNFPDFCPKQILCHKFPSNSSFDGFIAIEPTSFFLAQIVRATGCCQWTLAHAQCHA